MNWIKVKSNKDIPSDYFTNRELLLLKDSDGMIGVGYWNSYGWVLNIPGSELEVYFNDIIEYCELK